LQKNQQKIGIFDSKQSQIMKKLIITLVFEKNADFFRRKLQKIITSTPGIVVLFRPESGTLQKILFCFETFHEKKFFVHPEQQLLH
jgi:hypothetical protein